MHLPKSEQLNAVAVVNPWLHRDAAAFGEPVCRLRLAAHGGRVRRHVGQFP